MNYTRLSRLSGRVGDMTYIGGGSSLPASCLFTSLQAPDIEASEAVKFGGGGRITQGVLPFALSGRRYRAVPVRSRRTGRTFSGSNPTLRCHSASPEPETSGHPTTSNLVEGVGFEPTKVEPADLQSAPFGHSGTPPKPFSRHSSTGLARKKSANDAKARAKLQALLSLAGQFPGHHRTLRHALYKRGAATGQPLEKWCRLRDSNSRPTDYKSVALPSELSRHTDHSEAVRKRA